MTSNSPSKSYVVLCLALLFCVSFSGVIAEKRINQTAHAKQTFFRAGFSKILSQIEWMRLIQYRGSLMKVDKESAGVLYKRYDNLTDMDPLFSRAYQEGALEIAWQSPKETLDLLDKAMRVNGLKGKDWKIPFLAGFIAKNHLGDTQRAIKYLDEATKLPGRPGYVERYRINLVAESLYKEDPIKVLDLWVSCYLTGQGQLGASGRLLMMHSQSRNFMVEPSQGQDAERDMALSQVRKVSQRIVADAEKEIAAMKNDPVRVKFLQDRVAQTEKVVKLIHFGKHICPRCFHPYNAGDQYCSSCGQKVEVYGVCPFDGTVVHGSYCPKCGRKVEGN